MKVLSIKQPWASLIMGSRKDIEIRTWRTTHRGEILIHASKGIDTETCKLMGIDPKTLPTGCILGKANLKGIIKYCDPEHFQMDGSRHYNPPEWFDGLNYGWVFEDVVKFGEPIEAKGSLGLWDWEGG